MGVNMSENIPENITDNADEFFKAHLFKQMVDSTAGNNTVMQALFGKLGKNVISDGETDSAIKQMTELNNLMKNMQLNTLEIMKKMKEV